jgi:hypothetical protein
LEKRRDALEHVRRAKGGEAATHPLLGDELRKPSSSAPSFASGVMSGLARAKAEGITLGRPSIEDSDAGKYQAIKAALAAKQGVRRIARELQTGVGTVLRIKSELATT